MIAFIPFVDPLIGALDWWYLMLLPLALLVALVYKTMRSEDLADVPWQTLVATGKLLGAFLSCAAVLWLVLIILEHRW